MHTHRLLLIATAAGLCGSALASTWRDSYETALGEAKAGRWSQARLDFQQADHDRPGDSANSTTLPGWIFEQKKWRDGAPYSPSFLAAYCGLKYSMQLTGDERSRLLAQVSAEFEGLLKSGQRCPETFFFLDESYVFACDTAKRLALGRQYADFGVNGKWKVDTEAIAPEDEVLVSQLPPPPAPVKLARKPRQSVTKPASRATDPSSTNGAAQVATPAPAAKQRKQPRTPRAMVVSMTQPTPAQNTSLPPAHERSPSASTGHLPLEPQGPIKPVNPKSVLIKNPTLNPSEPLVGAIPAMADKYAIIIGNSESKTSGATLAFAADDAQLMRQALMFRAGYLDQNIETVVNGTAAQMAASLNALASRVPDKASVFIYFTGLGQNVNGRDYLAGVDWDGKDSAAMVAKDDIYKAFLTKGARIFAFYQADRDIQDGHYFGSEMPLVGCISQMQATIPGERVFSIFSNGKEVGLFTSAFVSTLGYFHSNRVPVMDFSHQVFQNMRGGISGGGSHQTPCLPVLTNMGTDSPF